MRKKIDIIGMVFCGVVLVVSLFMVVNLASPEGVEYNGDFNDTSLFCMKFDVPSDLPLVGEGSCFIEVITKPAYLMEAFFYGDINEVKKGDVVDLVVSDISIEEDEIALKIKLQKRKE